MPETMLSLIASDEAAREKIKKDTNSNFFVEAGAGSGKTTNLVSRMVSMVKSGCDVSKICAITFTKAAANEFFARFQKALVRESADETLSETEHKRVTDALNNIDLAFMGTIDSFCGMILSEHPIEAKVPYDSNIITQAELLNGFKMEYAKIQHGDVFYGEELRKESLRFSHFNDRPSDVFAEGVYKLWGIRNSNIVHSVPPETDPDILFKEEKGKFLDVLKNLLDHEEIVYLKNEGGRKGWDALNQKKNLLFGSWNRDIPELIRALSEISGLIVSPDADLSVLGMYGDSLFTPLYTPKGKLSRFQFDIDCDFYLPDKLKDLQCSVSIDFIIKACYRISENFRISGKLDYFDYLLYLRDMLKEDASNGGKLIRHIYDRHSYYLIDEFQDTNPLQAEVFFYLSAIDPDPDWRKCIPRPGSLFIVGDPKQSIYRFRNADVAQFLKVKDMFKPPVGEVLYLSRNFRSTPNLASAFNDMFSRLLPEDTAEQSRYHLIPVTDSAEVPEGLFGGVYFYNTMIPEKKTPEDMADPHKLADIISRLVNNPDYLISDLDENNNKITREITFSDFMIITPFKTHITQIMAKFSNCGIPFYVEGKVPFKDCPSLLGIIDIFKATVRSDDLYYSYKGLSYDIPDITTFAGLASSTPSAALFSMIMDKFRVFDLFGVHNMEYAYYANELLKSAEISGEVSTLDEAVTFLTELTSGTLEVERSISLSPDSNKVHIANLHKVKGLEANIVILADPKGNSFRPELRTEQLASGPESHVFRLGTLKTTEFVDYEEAEISSIDFEKIRLLYVAATRARQALIIGSALTGKGVPITNNYWERLLPYADKNIFEELPYKGLLSQDSKNAADAALLYSEGEAELCFNGSESRTSTYEIRRPSMISLKQVTSDEDDFEDFGDEAATVRKARPDAAIIGTMVHRLMEILVNSRNSIDLSDAVNTILKEYTYEPVNRERYETILATVGETIRSGGFRQVNDSPQDILTELLSADRVLTEVPFCHKDDDVIWHGVMDVLYLKSGKWHIIDYKTNLEKDDLDEEYQGQLRAYITALKEISGIDADALIYHIDV